MLCENCQKKPANLFIKAVTEEEIGEVKLCYKCAKDVGLLEGYAPEDFPSTPLLIIGLITFPLEMDLKIHRETLSRRCPNCGLSLDTFVKTNKFGCGECYLVFAEYLDNLFTKLHGATRHVEGDLQALEKEDRAFSSRLARLHERLREAVKGENYEEAARLRDKISSLKNTRKRHRYG